MISGFYGFPAHYTTDYRVKVGHHGKGLPLPTPLTTELIDASLQQVLLSFPFSRSSSRS